MLEFVGRLVGRPLLEIAALNCLDFGLAMSLIQRVQRETMKEEPELVSMDLDSPFESIHFHVVVEQKLNLLQYEAGELVKHFEVVALSGYSEELAAGFSFDSEDFEFVDDHSVVASHLQNIE